MYVWTPASRWSDFVNHSYDYGQDWTPLGPITIMYHKNIATKL